MTTLSTILAWGGVRAGYLVFGISSKSILYYSAYLVATVALFYFVLVFIVVLATGKHGIFSFDKREVSNVLASMTGGTLFFTAIFQGWAAVDLLFRHWHLLTYYGYDFGSGYVALISGLFGGLFVFLPGDILVGLILGIAGYCLAIICRFIIKIAWFPVSWIWCKFETYVNEKANRTDKRSSSKPRGLT